MGFKTDEWVLPDDAAAGWTDADETGSLAAMADSKTRQLKIQALKTQREQIKLRLWAEGEIDFGNQLAKCGLPMPLQCTSCGHIKTVETCCNRRWCPSCAWKIQARRLERYEGALKLMQWPLHIMLSVQNTETPDGVRYVRKCWSKFRRRKLLADKVLGGLVSVEVTNRGNGWHPHLHGIVDCEWLALHVPAPRQGESRDVVSQKLEHAKLELSKVWGNVTGQDHAIVSATRAAHGKGGEYVTKYAIKGAELVKCQEKLGPLLRVLECTRLISAFGSLYGRTAEMSGPVREGCLCEACASSKSMMPLGVIDAMIQDKTAARTLPSQPWERKQA